MFLILRSWVYFEFKCRVSFDFFFLNSWIIHGFLLKTMWDVFLYMVLLWKLCMMSFGEKNINYARFLIKKLCMLTVFIHSWKTVWNLATLLYTTFVDTVQKLCRISFFTVISSVFCINEYLWKFGLKVTVSNPRLMKNFYFILFYFDFTRLWAGRGITNWLPLVWINHLRNQLQLHGSKDRHYKFIMA